MARGNMKTLCAQHREHGGSSMTSEKNRLPRLAVVTSSQLANRMAQSDSAGVACVLTPIGITEERPCWVEAIDADITDIA